jgi:hypothetical protein
MSAPAKLEPGSIWSLFEVLNFHAEKFFHVLTVLAKLQVGIQAMLPSLAHAAANGEPIEFQNAPVWRADLDVVILQLGEMGLRGPRKAAERVRAIFEPGPDKDIGELMMHLGDLERRFKDELDGQLFLFLNTSERDHYEVNTPPFGMVVFDRFPIAIDDVAEASRCLALERGTAAVFHLMRVMESGLRALGRELGIPYAPSWDSYITQLDNLLSGKKYDTLTSDQKAKRPFYQAVLGDLISIKSAWRNPTMHIVSSYDVPQATRIFEAVKGLMQHLARELNPDPLPPPLTGQSG